MRIIQLVLIFAIGIAAYSNTLNAPFQFDDLGISNTDYLYSRVSSFGVRIIADLTFVLNHKLHGQAVFGFHLVNLCIHLTTAFILYFLVSEAVKSLIINSPVEPASNDSVKFLKFFLPFGVALLFVSHPIQTQSITYIVQRYTSLATLFYLGSVLAFLKARCSADMNLPRSASMAATGISVGSGILAMLCKEIAFTLPITLMVIEAMFFHGRLLKNKLFMTIAVTVMLIIPALHLLKHGAAGFGDIAYSIDRGTREELTYSRSDYFLTQLRVIVTYMRLLILPVNQNLDYDYTLQKHFMSVPVISSLLLHIVALGFSIFLFVKSRLNLKNGFVVNGICQRLASFGIIWFYLTLMVESSFIPIIDVIFEHRLYLPSVGGIIAITALGTIPACKTPRLATTVLLLLVALLAVATFQRNKVWNDELLLWEDTSKKSPDKSRVLNNLATSYISCGLPEEAAAPLLRAVEKQPGATDNLNNLGALLDQLPMYRGRYTNGRQYLYAGTRVNMRFLNNWFANTQNNLGLVYEHLGNKVSAKAKFKFSATLDPTNEFAWGNLFLESIALKDRDQALSALEKLNSLNPSVAKTLANAHQLH